MDACTSNPTAAEVDTGWVSLAGDVDSMGLTGWPASPTQQAQAPETEVDLRPPQSRVGASTHGCLSPNTKNTI